MSDIKLQDLFLAQNTIAPIANQTPLVDSLRLSEQVGGSVYLKLECVQETGSFKVRGAANKLLNLTEAERAKGVVTVSTGNHGRAVSYVAKRLGMDAVVCMSDRVPGNKVRAIEALGGQVMIVGGSQDEAEVRAKELRDEERMTLIHPFDDPLIIAGQGTIGLELLQARPDLDAVLVPLSGGGLISGIGLAVKSSSSDIRVVGVSMEQGPAMYHSLKAGQPVQVAEQDTLADSLSGGIGLENQHTYRMVQAYVDDVVLVSEAEIGEAIAFALTEHHLVLEGAGAVGIAALLHDRVEGDSRQTALVLSGSNIDTATLIELARLYNSE